MTEDFRPIGTVGRALPGAASDNTQIPQRLGQRGEQYVLPVGNFRRQQADEGSYFFAQNATIDASTTLAGHAAPVLADLYTKPLFYIRNTSTSLRVYLDFIHIQIITAGASGTSDNWAAECDTGAARGSSGTALTVVNPNMQSTNATACTVLGGAVTGAAATANQRKMGHGVFRPSIAITGDKYTFVFGGDPVENNVVSAAITHHVIPMPPVILGSTDQFLLHLYAPSQASAAVMKMSAGWSER